MISKTNDFFDDELPLFPDGKDFRKDELFLAQPKQSKKCQYCRIEKNLEAFYISTVKTRVGLVRRYSKNCKACDCKIFRGKYKAKPSVRNTAKKNREKRNQEISREQRRAERKRSRTKPINRMSALMIGWIGRGRLELAIRLLRYTPQDLVNDMQSKWEPGMSWDNFGSGYHEDKWQVDHITECCQFDLCNTEQFKHCHSLKNLRPRWAHLNMNSTGCSWRKRHVHLL